MNQSRLAMAMEKLFSTDYNCPMTNHPRHILYGEPPLALVPIAHDAVQVSPLIPNSLSLETLEPASLETATIYAPAGTIERRTVLAHALSALAVGGRLTALARKDKGGSRLAGDLTQFGCSVMDEPRSHHRIVTCVRPAQLSGIDEAIAAGSLAIHPAHGLWTHAGVFSWDRIDAGSALLINHLPPLAGKGADLGAGIGVLSRAVLASPGVTALTLVEIDARALAAAKRNISDPRAAFVWADVREDELPVGNLDFVVMNPPFHDTGIEDQSLGHAFIRRAAAALRHGGHCWLVANRHLPYEALLGEWFSTTRVVAIADGFKILESIR